MEVHEALHSAAISHVYVDCVHDPLQVYIQDYHLSANSIGVVADAKYSGNNDEQIVPGDFVTLETRLILFDRNIQCNLSDITWTAVLSNDTLLDPGDLSVSLRKIKTSLYPWHEESSSCKILFQAVFTVPGPDELQTLKFNCRKGLYVLLGLFGYAEEREFSNNFVAVPLLFGCSLSSARIGVDEFYIGSSIGGSSFKDYMSLPLSKLHEMVTFSMQVTVRRPNFIGRNWSVAFDDIDFQFYFRSSSQANDSEIMSNKLHIKGVTLDQGAQRGL